MDLAQLSALVADKELEVLSTPPWGNATELPGDLSCRTLSVSVDVGMSYSLSRFFRGCSIYDKFGPPATIRGRKPRKAEVRYIL
jgi:hypothetical protein